MQSKIQSWPPARFLYAALAVMPILAVFMPRAFSFFPALAGLALFLACGRPRELLDRRIFYPLLVLGGLALFSTLWSIHPLYTLKKSLVALATLLPAGLLASFALHIPAEEMRPYVRRISVALAAGALLIGLEIALGFPFQHVLLQLGRLDRISASHANRSVVAVLLLGLPALIALPRGRLKAALAAALLFMAGLTASQSSQLAFVIAALFALAFPFRRRLAYNALMAIIAALVFAAPLLAIWAFGALGTEVNSLPFLGKGSGFGAQRLEIWDFVSRYIAQHPCLGYGMEATRQVTDFGNAQRFFHHPTVLHPHNFALQAWIEFGALGALVVASLIVALLTLLRGLPDAARVALPGFMALLSISAMGYGMWQGWWLGLVLSVAAFNIIFARLAIQGGAGLRQ
jgi:O-antigen ligase